LDKIERRSFFAETQLGFIRNQQGNFRTRAENYAIPSNQRGAAASATKPFCPTRRQTMLKKLSVVALGAFLSVAGVSGDTAVLAEAKISWHAFNLDSVRRKADDAFEMGTKVKDSLRTKLYPQ
jgi:hypothetical protein